MFVKDLLQKKLVSLNLRNVFVCLTLSTLSCRNFKVFKFLTGENTVSFKNAQKYNVGKHEILRAWLYNNIVLFKTASRLIVQGLLFLGIGENKSRSRF